MVCLLEGLPDLRYLVKTARPRLSYIRAVCTVHFHQGGGSRHSPTKVIRGGLVGNALTAIAGPLPREVACSTPARSKSAALIEPFRSVPPSFLF